MLLLTFLLVIRKLTRKYLHHPCKFLTFELHKLKVNSLTLMHFAKLARSTKVNQKEFRMHRFNDFLPSPAMPA